MFWICPKCGTQIDFHDQVKYLFDDTGDANFDPESGVILHLITCDVCESYWTMSISKREQL